MICLVLADIILGRFVLIYLFLVLTLFAYKIINIPLENIHTLFKCDWEKKRRKRKRQRSTTKKTFRFHFYLTHWLAYFHSLVHFLSLSLYRSRASSFSVRFVVPFYIHSFSSFLLLLRVRTRTRAQTQTHTHTLSGESCTKAFIFEPIGKKNKRKRRKKKHCM